MDQQKLIELITAQVLKEMQSSSQQGSSGETQQPAGTGGSGFSPSRSPQELAQYIDHTQLKPDAPVEAFDKLCDEAVKYQFKSVCVNSSWVGYVSRKLQGTKVKVCSVVGFPLGAMTSRSKAFETREAIEAGASEIDMVLAIGRLKQGDLKYVEEDILAVRRATRSTTVLKVIIETSMLTQEEKVLACQISKKAGADFVKTSTGFGGGGATVEDVALMKSVVGKDVEVKASGGVRTYQDALDMIGSGATRIGTGSGVAVITGTKATGNY